MIEATQESPMRAGVKKIVKTGAGTVVYRTATQDDLTAIVGLLADDPLGANRETPTEPLPETYRLAFAAMAEQKGNEIILGEQNGEIVSCLQLTILPGLSRQGATRALIEAVRVSSRRRGTGIGESMLRHAIDRARAAGCTLVQLTTDKSRIDAHRFYEKLGFVASHLGMKLEIK